MLSSFWVTSSSIRVGSALMGVENSRFNKDARRCGGYAQMKNNLQRLQRQEKVLTKIVAGQTQRQRGAEGIGGERGLREEVSDNDLSPI